MAARPRSPSAVCLAALVALLAGICQGDFIRVQNGVFVQDDCREWLFSGYNTWQPIEMALDMCCGGRDGLNGQFAEAARNNLNVVRFFGFPALRGFNLQTRPGQYTEQAFVGIDRVIAAASDHGLKVLIALTNNWNYNDLQTDWKCSYTNWSSSATQCDDFFSDRGAIQMYKDHVRTFLGRINTVNGRTYSQDQTILGWNLINEPRSAKPNGAAEVQAWVAELAPYVKALAPQQLITIGEDGFYQASNCEAAYINPVNNGGGGSWPMQTGQDFLPNHAVDGIDFAGMHLWPDNWQRTDMHWSQNWIWSHLVWAERRLGKPLVLEEYGKDVGYYNGDQTSPYQTFTDQWQHYRQTYDVAAMSLQQGRGLKGIMFWHWAGVDDNAPNGEGSTIFSYSGVWRDIIVPHSGMVAGYNANASRPLDAPADPAALAQPAAPVPAAAPSDAPVRDGAARNVVPGAVAGAGRRTGPNLQWATSGTATQAPAVAPIDPVTPTISVTPPAVAQPVIADAPAPSRIGAALAFVTVLPAALRLIHM
ncbi:hypothetical protein WJX81_001819 [Elliptochloris bilobata]|uniref:mannan endo-1,4-beta-mannosidase n=1 Tax=Elliptochloris bilobata TaxID=381761 RepID=A0AAW1RQ54_9CHLO